MPNANIEALDRRAQAVYAEGLDDTSREELASLGLALVEHLARRFTGRGEPLDDLKQVASIGLLKSIDRFDPERGVRFSTYATPTIMGELKRHFRDAGWSMHVPRQLKERVLRLRDVIDRMSQEIGRSPTIAEIAARAGLSSEEVVAGLDASSAYAVDSLDAPRDDDPTSSPAVGEEDWSLELAERWTSVTPLLRALETRERHILYLRFVKGLTQSQIAREIGYSQMHVSRLLARTLEHLREAASAVDEQV